MKTLFLLITFTTFYLTTTAQANQIHYTLKGYLPVVWGAGPGNGSNSVQVCFPTFALALQNRSRNFHQVELCDLAFDRYEASILDGKVTSFTLGIRYSYGIELWRSKTNKLKAFIVPGVHAVYDHSQFNPRVSFQYPTRSNEFTGELEVAPILSYHFCKHFSAELNIPVMIIGLTQSYYHNLNPLASEEVQHQNSFTPYLGPQYFLGRAGLAFTW